MDGARGHGLFLLGRFVQCPPLPLLENIAERIGNRRVIVFPADFFFGGTLEADKMIARDPALFSVKGRERDRIGDILVVKNDRRGSERLLSGVRVDSDRKEENENERKNAQG